MLKILAVLACTTAFGAVAGAEEPIRYDREQFEERARIREEARRDLDRRLADCHSYRCRWRVKHEWRAEHPRMRY